MHPLKLEKAVALFIWMDRLKSGKHIASTAKRS